MVPEGRRHATSNVSTIGQAAFRSVSLVSGTRGACDSSCARPGGAGHCPTDGAVSVDDLARAAAQCCDAQWRSGVSGHHGAVAFRACGPAAEACKTGGQRGLAGLCAGASGRGGREPKRGDDSWAGRILEGTPTWTSAATTMGGGMEPGADCPPPAARLPGRRNNADQPRGHLPVALCARSGSSAPRADRLSAHRAGVAGSAGAQPRSGQSPCGPEVLISERPAEAGDRAVPGHWEGDLILGLGSSAIGTLVERTTRLTMLLHLPRMPEHGCGPRVKNGPALAGHGADAVRDAIARTITTLPELLRQSLTWDQGTEMAQHSRLTIDTGLRVYFCDPHSPWQRGTNENTNGLLRQYFPKGTDLCLHSANELAAVAAALNTRPRKTLGWRTPAEMFDQVLRSVQPAVATTS